MWLPCGERSVREMYSEVTPYISLKLHLVLLAQWYNAQTVQTAFKYDNIQWIRICVTNVD